MQPPSLRLSYMSIPARLMQVRVLVPRTRESKQMEPNAMSQADLFPLTLHDQIIPEIVQNDRSGIICNITARPAPPARASAYMWPRSENVLQDSWQYDSAPVRMGLWRRRQAQPPT